MLHNVIMFTFSASMKKTSKEKRSLKSTNVHSNKNNSNSSCETNCESFKNDKALVQDISQCVTKTSLGKISVKCATSRSLADVLKTTNEQQEMITVERKDCENYHHASGRQAAVRETAETLPNSKTDHKKDSSDASRQHVRKGLCRALSVR